MTYTIRGLKSSDIIRQITRISTKIDKLQDMRLNDPRFNYLRYNFVRQILFSKLEQIIFLYILRDDFNLAKTIIRYTLKKNPPRQKFFQLNEMLKDLAAYTFVNKGDGKDYLVDVPIPIGNIIYQLDQAGQI